MIPAWKLRRELLRTREQLAGLYGKAAGGMITRRYDRARATSLVHTSGDVPETGRVAAFLMYQPGDIPASVLDTCKLLQRAGFAPLIISNAPLGAQVKAQLKPVSWHIVERPNQGYDFGGYREAVMHLWDRGKNPDELIILNDSVWVIPDLFAPFLAAMQDEQADIAGSVIRSKGDKRWIESYFYLISGAAFRSEPFAAFWRSYKLIDSKYVVIRKGERDFSVSMDAGGLSLACIADNAKFLEQIATLDDGTLRDMLRFMNTEDTGTAERAAAYLAAEGGPAWREDVVDFARGVLHTGRVWNSVFPVPSQTRFGNPFIKKSLEPLNVGWRDKVLQAYEEGALPDPGAVVRKEIMERQKAGASHRPHWVTRRV